LGLAEVWDLRQARPAASAAELAGLETDMLAGFVLARAAAGLSDDTVSSDVSHLAQLRAWLDRPLWEMEPGDADAYFGRVLRDAAPGTRLARSQALKTYFVYLELRHKVELHQLTGRVVECPIDEMNRPRGRRQARLRIPPSPQQVATLFAGWRGELVTCRKFAPTARNYTAARLMAEVGLRVNETRSLDLGDVKWNLGRFGRLHVRHGKGPRLRAPRADGPVDQRRRADAALVRRGRVGRLRRRPHRTRRAAAALRAHQLGRVPGPGRRRGPARRARRLRWAAPAGLESAGDPARAAPLLRQRALRRRDGPGRDPGDARARLGGHHEAPAARPAPGPVQLRLLDPPRDYRRVDPDAPADPDNRWLAWALYLAHRLGEVRGWKKSLRVAVARGLRIVLSVHVEGEIISYTAMFPPLRALDISVERVADVLTEMTLLLDDRPSSFEAWLERQLDGLAGGIRDDVEAWLRTLHDGGPRTPARGPEAAGNFLARVRPVLTGWSANHHHLREITCDEVLAVLDEHYGAARSNLPLALRSLFTHCQRRRTIFRNPTARIKVGEHPQRVLQPLHPQQVEQAIAAATTPAARLLVTLAVVYGARPGAARALQLDDVDLGNRRLLLADADRPITS